MKQTKHDTDIQQIGRGLDEIKKYHFQDRKHLLEEHKSRENKRQRSERQIEHGNTNLSLSHETMLQRIQSTPSYNSPDNDYNYLITELFDEAVHQIEHEFHKDLKFERQAFDTLRVITEDFLEELMKKMKSYATKEKRITIMPKDLRRATNEVHGSIYRKQ